MLTAALINGATSHALDFDDTHTMMRGHPSAPVVPAALALAEREGIDGAAFLDAVIAGIETECRLGALLNPGHYALGFHATGTLGTFGAAMACARLLGLDRERTPAGDGAGGDAGGGAEVRLRDDGEAAARGARGTERAALGAAGARRVHGRTRRSSRRRRGSLRRTAAASRMRRGWSGSASGS